MLRGFGSKIWNRFFLWGMMGFLLVPAGGCTDIGSPESPFNNPSLRSLVWNSTTPARIDSNSGIAFSPEITVEPDGGGTAFAVWVERVDLNEFDLKPAVYHIHARRFSGGNWAGTDAGSGCNPGGDNGLDDGICVLDSGSRDFDAWAPEITMDNNGDAILVWQQADASDCDGALGGVQTCTSIYAREYTAGGSWTPAAIIDGGNTPASSPDVAMEPDGGGTAFAVWSQMASEAEAWSTSADRGGNTIVDLEEYNGKIYAAEMDGGTANVLVLNERTGTWSLSTTFGAITIYSLQTYCRNSEASNQDNCRLYAGLGTGADGGGDVYLFDGTAWTDIFNAGAIGTGDSQTMLDFTVVNGILYAVGATGSGGGIFGCDSVLGPDLLAEGGGGGASNMCDASADWYEAFNDADPGGGAAAITAASGYGDILTYSHGNYVALGLPASGDKGDSTDMFVGPSDDFGIFANLGFSINDFEAFDGLLYAAGNNGQVYLCTPTGAGFRPGACDTAAEWDSVWNPGLGPVRVLKPYPATNRLYAGVGAGTAAIYQCSPGNTTTINWTGFNGTTATVDYSSCGVGDWTQSSTFAGRDYVASIGLSNGFIYAGTGAGAGDGDIFKRTEYDDTQIMARRFTGGGWTNSDATSGCPSVHRADDGICDLDAAIDDASKPLVAMDNAGQATVVFNQFASRDCSRSVFLNNSDDVEPSITKQVDKTAIFTSVYYVICFEDRLEVDRFDGTEWLGALDITSLESLGVEQDNISDAWANITCEDIGISGMLGGEAEAVNRVNPCVDIGQYDLAMDRAGNVSVTVNTFEWVVTTEADWDSTPTECDPGGIGGVQGGEPGTINHRCFEITATQDLRVYAKGYGQGQVWASESWTQNSLAAYEWRSDPLNDGATALSTCAAVTPLDNNTGAQNSSGLQIMNCNLMSPVIAVEQNPAGDDGVGSAFAAYERFNGSIWNVVVHQCVDNNGNGNCGDAGEWGTVVDADNCADNAATCWDNVASNAAQDSRAPQIAMDGLGNAMLVWPEHTGGATWLVYANRFSGGWSGAGLVNAPAANFHYFEPMVDMEAGSGGAGNAITVFNALDSLQILFNIEGSRWTP